MRFAFGCARELYASRVHPRVLLGPEDVATLRRRARSGYARAILDGMRRKVGPLAEWLLAQTDLVEALTVQYRDANYGCLWNLHDMAMVGLLDGDRRAIEAVKRTLLAMVRMDAERAEHLGFRGSVYCMVFGLYPLAFDLLHSEFTADEARRFCKWIVSRNIRPAIRKAWPLYFKCAGANTPICETLPALIGLMSVLNDPGVPDLSSETARLISLLEATLHTAINPDGYPEEDMGYGTCVVAALAQIVEPLRRAGLYDVYACCPRYARFGQAVLHFVQPWGENLSTTGDHGDDFGWREMVLARQAEESGDAALLWLLQTLSYGWHPAHRLPKDRPHTFLEVPLRRGLQVPASAVSLLFADKFRKAKHPSMTNPPTQFRDRGRGIVSFRSGWGKDDTLVVFDASQRSPSGQGHQHASCGHFSLSALGEYFAVDTGRYNMEQNCHNVVLVDGRSGRSTDGEWRMMYEHGVLIDYEPGEFCDSAAVDSSHQHDCYWARRHLGLVKGRGAPAYVWTVDDINKANDYREFHWQLHTSPENKITIHGETAVIEGWRHGNLLDVHFALPDPKLYPKPHTLKLSQDVATPSSYNYVTAPYERAKQFSRPADMVHYSVFYRPRLLAKVAGYNGRFMSVMVPRRRGTERAQVVRLASIANSIAVKITFPQVEDTIIFAYEHNLLEAGDVVGRGQWCVVRRSRRSGHVLCHALGHGTSLAVSARRLA